jgi:hypothetical protein
MALDAILATVAGGGAGGGLLTLSERLVEIDKLLI